MARKTVVFRVFVIKNEDLTHEEADLEAQLKAKLANTNVEDRLKNVSDDNDKVKDLLSSYAPAANTQGDYLYGTVMQLKPAREISALPDDYLQKPSLNENELREIVEIAGKTICSRIYHFLIKNKYLITDLKDTSTISVFSNYISKLLPEKKYGFVPAISDKNLKLSNIVHVVFSDNFDNQSGEMTIKNPVMKLIKKMSPQVRGLNKIMENKLVRAKMTIDFSRPKNVTKDDYARQLGALLAPVQDLSFVQFTMNNGQQIYGHELAFSKRITLEADIISDITYIEAMKGVVSELSVVQ